MGYPVVPDLTKTAHMENPVWATYSIESIVYSAGGIKIDHVIADCTLTYFKVNRKLSISREIMLSYMKDGQDYYYKGRKLFIEPVNNIPFIHFEQSSTPRDILE